MPVKKCGKKWRIGKGKCMYRSKASAERAYKGYLGHKFSEGAKLSAWDINEARDMPKAIAHLIISGLTKDEALDALGVKDDVFHELYEQSVIAHIGAIVDADIARMHIGHDTSFLSSALEEDLKFEYGLDPANEEGIGIPMPIERHLIYGAVGRKNGNLHKVYFGFMCMTPDYKWYINNRGYTPIGDASYKEIHASMAKMCHGLTVRGDDPLNEPYFDAYVNLYIRGIVESRMRLDEFKMMTKDGETIAFKGVPGGLDNRADFIWRIDDELVRKGGKIDKNTVFLAKHWLSKIGGSSKWPEAAKLVAWLQSNLGKVMLKDPHEESSSYIIVDDGGKAPEEMIAKRAYPSQRKKRAPDIVWTDEMLSKLRDLWDEGKTGAEIGAILGLGRQNVINKAKKMNLAPRRPSR